MFSSPEPSLTEYNSNIYFKLERSSDSWVAIESLKKPQELTVISQISSKTSRGKKDSSTQKDTIKDITSDSKVNSYFPYR